MNLIKFVVAGFETNSTKYPAGKNFDAASICFGMNSSGKNIPDMNAVIRDTTDISPLNTCLSFVIAMKSLAIETVVNP